MIKFLIFTSLFFSLDAAAIDPCNLSSKTPNVVVTSIDRLTQASFSENPACLVVVNKKGARSKHIKDIDEVTDIAPNPSIGLSFDAKYITVQFDAGEDTHVVLVLRSDNLRTVLADEFQSAIWMKKSNKLLLVPNYGMMEFQKKKGLVLFSPEMNQKEIIAGEYFFVGKVNVDGNQIIGDIVEYRNREPVISTVKYDILKRRLIGKWLVESN
jgi:hypothetical protein